MWESGVLRLTEWESISCRKRPDIAEGQAQLKTGDEKFSARASLLRQDRALIGKERTLELDTEISGKENFLYSMSLNPQFLPNPLGLLKWPMLLTGRNSPPFCLMITQTPQICQCLSGKQLPSWGSVTVSPPGQHIHNQSHSSAINWRLAGSTTGRKTSFAK